MRKYISLLCLITVVGAGRAFAEPPKGISQFVVDNASAVTVQGVITEAQVGHFANSHPVLDVYMCQLNPFVAARNGVSADKLKGNMISYTKSLVDAGKIARDTAEGTEYSYLLGIASALGQNNNAYALSVVAAVKDNPELAIAQVYHHLLSGFVNNPNVHDRAMKTAVDQIIQKLSAHISGQKASESNAAMAALLESVRPVLSFNAPPMQAKVDTGCCGCCGTVEKAAENEVKAVEQAAKADAKVCCGCWNSSSDDTTASAEPTPPKEGRSCSIM